MNRTLYVLGVLLFAATTCYASEVLTDDADTDPRFWTNNNSTSLSISYASLVYGLFGLLALGLLAALLAYYLFGSDAGTGTGYTSYSSYGSSRAASLDPYAMSWDKLSILDWIAMLEEVYRKFDGTDMDCQMRVVCELHQNEANWGSTARKMNDAFSYLQYLELLNLPTDFRMILDNFLEAANKGRTSQKDCGDIYKDCEFSMKTLLNKYNGSNSI